MSTAGRYIRWTPPQERPRLLPIPLPRPAGPLWLVWRQHRAVYCTVLALAAVASAWALWQRHRLAADVQAYADVCGLDRFCTQPVPDATETVLRRFPPILSYLPSAVAALLGAPLFAQDIDRGTHRLAWTQSYGRGEWVTAKLMTTAVVTTAGALLITTPVTWWWYTVWRGREGDGSVGIAWRSIASGNDWAFFEYTGAVGIAHLLLALIAGATVGLVLRNIVLAVAVAAASGYGLQSGLRWLRPHLVPAQIHPSPTVDYPPLPPNTWHLGGGYLRTDGTLTSTAPCPQPYPGNPQTECLHAHGLQSPYTEDLRGAQFLPLHLVETALCLTVAAILTTLCTIYVHRITTR
ncbi:hypothetical protein QF026_001449 [Streptomyces aurantiacus]|uniref:cell wall protein n=1 Tax=Streptomyces aurantiacus TaxID=47760 RepID=UPI00278E43E7|nr:cell wall protein [Streptomyces aurantiacus]MDQ0772983.1 hypothetical protein [Streptomyces aurantiacus]